LPGTAALVCRSRGQPTPIRDPHHSYTVLPALILAAAVPGCVGSMKASAPKNVSAIKIPDRIGKYPIINEVGHGSTGTVFLSHDPYYGRDVAIKVYNIEAGGDDERARVARKMFLSEAHMVGMLHHPNILPIYDAGEENGHCYIVTEHVHGARTLSAYCRPDNLLRLDDVVEIMFKCAKALHYAHSRGVIHRDIKPSNIMLTTDSDVRIIDFGIALVADSEISRIEGIAGSPSYMSPEQVQSLELSNRSDLYSLGAVMYELLTGVRPFRAGNLAKLLHQIVYATPAPVHTLRADVPEEIENVVAVAMQKDPARRYQSGLDFAAELTRVHQTLRQQYSRIIHAAAAAEVLPRIFTRRDSRGAARQPLAGICRRRADREGRRDG
jgi:serine/threonine protein kinase